MIVGIFQAFLASFSSQEICLSKIESEGKIERVIEPGKVWWVYHKATFWRARSLTSKSFHKGDWVRVVGCEGITLLIEPQTNS